MGEVSCARVLLVGKSGVGKSAFINYFLDKDIAQVGDGKPVTTEWKEYNIDFNGFKIEIHDTVGVEVEKFNEWKEDTLNKIKTRNNDNDISKWYHTMLYCFSASNSRIEDAEVEIIKEIKKNVSQRMHIILTHCDDMDNEHKKNKIDEIIKKIESSLGSDIRIYKVCSINQKKRSGVEIVKFGKEEIVEDIFQILWEDISKKVSEEWAKKLKEETLDFLLQIYNETKTGLDKKSKTGHFKNILSLEYDKHSDDYIKKTIEPLLNIYNSYHNIAENSNDGLISSKLIDVSNLRRKILDIKKIVTESDLHKTFLSFNHILLPLPLFLLDIITAIKRHKDHKRILAELYIMYCKVRCDINSYPFEEEIYKELLEVIK